MAGSEDCATPQWVHFFSYQLDRSPKALRQFGVEWQAVELASLKNYRLVFNVLDDERFFFERRGIANLMPRIGAETEGLLYTLPDSALPQLDQWAGVDRLKYYRKMAPVRKHNGDTVQAFTYIAWPDVTANGLRPSNRYLQRLVQEARCRGCSQQFVHWLQAHPTAC